MHILESSINEHPEIVSLRTKCGHWEIDTVVAHNGSKESVVLTLVEKETDYYIAIKIPVKDSVSVKTLCKYLGKNMVKISSPRYLRPLLLTTGVNLKI